MSSKTTQYHNYLKLIAPYKAPCLILDLDSLDQNINEIKKISGGHKIRVATKSIRSQYVLKYLESKLGEIYQGLMSFSLEESLRLASVGHKDILIGYPVVDKSELERFIQSEFLESITLMTDLSFHLDLLEEIGSKYQKSFRICIDMDMSVDFPGLHFGVWRSSIRSLSKLEAFLKYLEGKKWIKLVGLMGYEAQVAGVTDNLIKSGTKNYIIQMLKKKSLSKIARRRKEMATLVKNFGHELEFINGGGTGSLKETIKESVVTEVTIGSGFYSPALFDYYKDFKLKPALFYALDVTRNPKENIFTCAGGGHTASGSIESIKAPKPFLPLNFSLMPLEGAGEVQTPIKYQGEENLLGSRVFFRHAKAGEICEYFSEIIRVRSDHVDGTNLTYRGDGICPP